MLKQADPTCALMKKTLSCFTWGACQEHYIYRFNSCSQKINRSHAHAHDSRTHDSRTTHSHEHKASNGTTTGIVGISSSTWCCSSRLTRPVLRGRKHSPVLTGVRSICSSNFVHSSSNSSRSSSSSGSSSSSSSSSRSIVVPGVAQAGRPNLCFDENNTELFYLGCVPRILYR